MARVLGQKLENRSYLIYGWLLREKVWNAQGIEALPLHHDCQTYILLNEVK